MIHVQFLQNVGAGTSHLVLALFVSTQIHVGDTMHGNKKNNNNKQTKRYIHITKKGDTSINRDLSCYMLVCL
jgi:hypothetical protein